MAIWQKQAEEDVKCIEKSSYNFQWNQDFNHNPLYPKLERQYRFKVKLNDYWINLHKN